MNISLKRRLVQTNILIAPGVYDLSGAAVAYTRLGRPDIGLTSVSEMTDTMALIADRVDVPVIIDADNGFGNALNAQRTVRLYERAGGSALQIEDQSYPKRCGHLAEKTLIATGEMVGKIKAMVDARHAEDTLIIARTDAIGVEGFEPALERAEHYVAAGADVLFVEAPQTGEQLSQISKQFGSRIPLLANMVEGGATPISDAADLESQGYSIVIFPGGIVRALAHTAIDYYNNLQETGSNTAFKDRMFDFKGLNDVLGTDETLAQGKRYS